MGPQATCPTCERVLGDQHDFLMKKFHKETKTYQDEIKTIETNLIVLNENYNQEKKKLIAIRKKEEYLH